MKLISLLSLILLFWGVPKQVVSCPIPFLQPTDRLADQAYPYVDTLMTALLTRTQVAGISLSVRQAGKMIYAKGFGYADVAAQIPMKPTSQVRTASVAKVITTTALGKLATAGKLDLDAPLKTYLPDLAAPYADLTTRQIAGHTAGIPHRPTSQKATKKHYTEVREMAKLVEVAPLLFEPGTKYQYSTMGYNLLAALIEAISGKRYVDYLDEDIFGPLNMNQTFPENLAKLSEADTKSYYLKNGKLLLDKKLQDGSYKLAGAGFRSTSQDLAKMMDAYANGFLSQEVVQMMFTSNALTNGTSTQVGMGWRLNKDLGNRSTIEHAGSWQGARTVIVYYPASQLTVSIMINTQCTLFIEETAHLIAQLFLEDQPQNMDFMSLDQAITLTNNRSDGSIETYAGRLSFSDEHRGALTIATERDWLTQNPIYYVTGKKHFALATQYGLMYLHLTLAPTLTGKLYQYQMIGDPYHVLQRPMLTFQAKN